MPERIGIEPSKKDLEFRRKQQAQSAREFTVLPKPVKGNGEPIVIQSQEAARLQKYLTEREPFFELKLAKKLSKKRPERPVKKTREITRPASPVSADFLERAARLKKIQAEEDKRFKRKAGLTMGMAAALGLGGIGAGVYLDYKGEETERAKATEVRIAQIKKDKSKILVGGQNYELASDVKEAIGPAKTSLGVNEIDYHNRTSPAERQGNEHFELSAPDSHVEGYYLEFIGTELVRNKETGRAQWVNEETFEEQMVSKFAPDKYLIKQTRSLNGDVRIPTREGDKIIAAVAKDGAEIKISREKRGGNYILSGQSAKVELYFEPEENSVYKTAPVEPKEKQELADFKKLEPKWQKIIATLRASSKLSTEEKVAILAAEVGESYVYNDDKKLDKQAMGDSVENISAAIVNSNEGICNTAATKLTAVLRAAGIPARIAAGFAYDSYGNGEPHMWAQTNIDGKWISVESLTGSKDAARGKKTVSEEQVAGKPRFIAKAKETDKLRRNNYYVIRDFHHQVVDIDPEDKIIADAAATLVEVIKNDSANLELALQQGGLWGMGKELLKSKAFSDKQLVAWHRRFYKHNSGLTAEEVKVLRSIAAEVLQQKLAHVLRDTGVAKFPQPKLSKIDKENLAYLTQEREAAKKLLLAAKEKEEAEDFEVRNAQSKLYWAECRVDEAKFGDKKAWGQAVQKWEKRIKPKDAEAVWQKVSAEVKAEDLIRAVESKLQYTDLESEKD